MYEYEYEIDHIQWPQGSPTGLPASVVVRVPSSVVDGDDEEEFEAYLVEAVTEKVGIKPSELGSYELYEDDD